MGQHADSAAGEVDLGAPAGVGDLLIDRGIV